MAESSISLSLENIQTKQERLSEQVREHKEKIEQRFKSYHIMLEVKQQSLFQRLDQILTKINKSVQDQTAALFELYEMRTSIEQRIKLNKHFELREDTSKRVSLEIKRAELQANMFPDVIVDWNGDFELLCDKMCSIEESYKSYTGKLAPVWCGVRQGSGPDELSQPCGVAIDPSSKNIYVIDRGNSRVQIFNRDGLYLSSIKNRDFKKFWGIHLDQKYIYISCYAERKVMRINVQDQKYIQSPRTVPAGRTISLCKYFRIKQHCIRIS